MKYFIFTLGCQMNVSDSLKIGKVLQSLGLKPTLEKQADLIVVNACSVRQKAVDRIWGKLKLWKKFSNQPINKSTNKLVFITGCVLPKDKKKFESKVDAIFSISDLPRLPDALSRQAIGGQAKLPQFLKKKIKFQVSDYLEISSLPAESRDEIFIPIMTGCDNFCSYCAVPYTRGRERSRKESEIICEVKEALKRGSKKITLLGQNVNSYKPDFVKLLQKLTKIPGDFQIKFLTSNPWDFPKSLIELIAKEPKISKEIHLPIQSGDDEILRKMNRRYTVAQYLKIIENLKLKIENLFLSTDIIVGFPGETKKAFQNTVSLCQKAKFDKAYIAQYSPRAGTTAAKLKDDVPQKEKKRRWKILDQFINKKANV